MHSLAMTGQYPLETIVRQPLHRLGLLRPRIPAVVLGRRKLPSVSIPIEMVAREQKPIPEEQDAMTLRVPGRLNRQKTRCQLPRTIAFENHFSTGLRRQFVAMDDAATSKVLCILFRISHVVPVREKDMGDAAQRLKLPHQRRDKLG